MHINNSWRAISERLIPVDAPDIQCIELKRAYYLGAAAMYKIMLENLRRTSLSVGDTEKFLTEIKNEIEGFKVDIIRNIA